MVSARIKLGSVQPVPRPAYGVPGRESKGSRLYKSIYHLVRTLTSSIESDGELVTLVW